MKTIVSPLDIEPLLEDFGSHLLHTAGLAPATCNRWVFYSRAFLNAHCSSALPMDLRKLGPEILLHYVLERSRHFPPARLQQMGSGLRSFCRFLHLSGRAHHDLSSAIPRIGAGGREDLPDYLSCQQVTELRNSVNTESPTSKRNYAIILCLSGLGMRAGEVAGLTLDQIDWRAGVITLSPTKGRRERQLPVPKDVGGAIARYLRHARPKSSLRTLFLSLRGKPLCSNTVSAVAVAAIKKANIKAARPGSHLLRHSVASNLVQQGVSLKAVADLLGHTNLQTTQVYAKVNLPMLQEVAMPWPEEVRP